MAEGAIHTHSCNFDKYEFLNIPQYIEQMKSININTSYFVLLWKKSVHLQSWTSNTWHHSTVSSLTMPPIVHYYHLRRALPCPPGHRGWIFVPKANSPNWKNLHDKIFTPHLNTLHINQPLACCQQSNISTRVVSRNLLRPPEAMGSIKKL